MAGPRADLLVSLASESDWTDDDLDEAIRAGLVIRGPSGDVRFVHGPMPRVVLARTPASTVRATHRRAAEAAARLGLPPGVVVGHLVESAGMPDAEVADELQREAERAECLDQLVLASRAWQAAARLSTTVPGSADRALHGLRLVIVNGLDYAGADDLLEILDRADLDEEASCWVEWLRALQRSEADPQSALAAQWSTIGRARVAAPQTVRALLWDTAMNAWTLGDPESGLRAAREYAALEARHGSVEGSSEPPWAGTALVAAGLLQAGEVAQGWQLRQLATEAAATADPAGQPFDRLLDIVFLDDLLLDDSAAANERLLVAAQRASEGSAALACLLGIHAWRARARGDWAKAAELLARGRPMAASTGATGAQLGMAALAVELAGMAGDDDVLRDEGGRLRVEATRLGDRRRLATLDRAVGLRALADGRPDAARTALAAAADLPFLGRGLRDAVLPARVDLVEVLVRTGDVAGARSRQRRLHDLLAGMDDPLAQSLDRRAAALVCEGDEADGHFHAAVQLHPPDRDPFERARTLLLQGEFLRREHRRPEARAALLEAERLFEGQGAMPWLARTRQELRAAGGQPAPDRGADPLTVQERAVACAVAEGRTNREVAEALFLSPRTVEYHLGSVYRKLGVHGRGALAHRLLEEPPRSAAG